MGVFPLTPTESWLLIIGGALVLSGIVMALKALPRRRIP